MLRLSGDLTEVNKIKRVQVVSVKSPKLKGTGLRWEERYIKEF